MISTKCSGPAGKDPKDAKDESIRAELWWLDDQPE